MPDGWAGSVVAMHRVRGERRQADRHVLGAIRLRCAVAYPLTRVRDHRLARANVEGAGLTLDPQQTAQDDGDLLELGLLAVPASRRATPSAPRSAFRGRSSRGR